MQSALPGQHAASLQDIADRLGMLKGSLYYYIQSKEDLLFDVIKASSPRPMSSVRSPFGSIMVLPSCCMDRQGWPEGGSMSS